MFLRAVRAEHPDPAMRARAGLALATHLRWHVLQKHGRFQRVRNVNPAPELGDNWSLRQLHLDLAEEVRLLKEVEGICRDTIAGYAEEEWAAFPSTVREFDHPTKTTMGKEAQAILDSLDRIDIRRVAIGRPAPELAAVDSEGKPFNLSEFRGRVVLVGFGGENCLPCRAMIPCEQALVKRLEGRPFALLGFEFGYGPGEPEQARLKGFLGREKITWRVCSGWQRNADVFQEWNIQGLPVFYLIDDRGVIRQRFDGYTEAHILNAAVDGLVKEAEERPGLPKSK